MRTSPWIALALCTAFALAARADDADVLKRLEEVRMDLHLDHVPWVDAVIEVQKATSLNIVIDNRAVQEFSDYQVTLDLTQVRAAHALRWILCGRPLSWRVASGVLVVAPREGNEDLVQLRLYDVTDIVSQPRDFAPAGAPAERGMATDELVDLVQTSVGPGQWDGPSYGIQVAGNSLVVHHTPAVHDQIERLLSTLGARAHFTLTFDARVVELTGDALPGAPRLGSLAPGQVLLSPADAAALLSRADGAVTTLEAARFTCMNGQLMHVRLEQRVAALSGAVREKQPGAGIRLDSRQTLLAVSPIMVAGRNQVLIDLDAHLADPATPPERVVLDDARIECARGAGRGLRTSFVCANGGGALFVLGPAGDRVRALLLRATSSAPPATVSTPVEAVPATDPEEAAVNGFLDKPIDLQLPGVPLSEAVQKIAAAGPVNCVLDPELRTEGVADVAVTLTLKQIQARAAIQLMSRMLDLSWTYRDGAILFARAERLESCRTEVYDVRDLLWRRLEVHWTLAGAESGTQDGGLVPEFEPTSHMEADELAEMVRNNIDPVTWEMEQRSIRMFYGLMVISQGPSVHRRIGAFLERLRLTKPRQVQVDARLLDVDPAVHDTLDAGGDGALPAASRTALEKALADGRARTAACWSLAGMNGQRFHGVHWLQRDWVAGYAAEPNPQPIVDHLTGGELLDLRPTLMSNSPGKLMIELRLVANEIPEAFAVEPAGGLTLQRPTVARGELATTVVAPDGETRLFSLGNVPGEKGVMRRVVVWTARTVE